MIKLRWTVIIMSLFLGSYAVLCIQSSGEVLKVIGGVVEKCDHLGGSKTTSISHATIKTDAGNYVISSMSGCSPGAKVNVYINRGILYFNSRYAAKKA